MLLSRLLRGAVSRTTLTTSMRAPLNKDIAMRMMSSDKPSSVADKILSFISYSLLGTITFGGIGGVYYLGLPDPNNVEADTSISGYFRRARKNSNQMYQDWRDPTPEPLLPPQKHPSQLSSDYTIVLDVEETLIHSQWTAKHGWRTVKRPGVDRLLQTCFQLGFEIVLFSEKEVMDSMMLMEKLDKYHIAEFKLFKGHMRFHNGELVKDLTLLNRDLSKVIVVDNHRESFAKHPNNGVCIKPFEGDPTDNSLEGLVVFLTHLMNAQPEDVREILKTYEHVEDVGEEMMRRQQALLETQLRNGS
eukprot:m.44412 g.44412  ORF g.44412 m.44412 type:complete len:303 (+) comp7168_c0_seq1:89-997(+)